jgi:DNA helicase HerA-like ATPase
MDATLGHVMAVAGSRIRADVMADRFTAASLRIGSMIKVRSADREVVGTISAAEIDGKGSAGHMTVQIDLLGEIVSSGDEPARFHRGISCHPAPGAAVGVAAEADLATVYIRPSGSNVSIGSLYHDPGRPAFALVDELLAKNFAILGATGSGKSCAVALMLSAILSDHPNAHIIVLDPHNEYASAFEERAEFFNVDNLQLPLWLLDFEEAVGVLVRGGTAQEQETQAIILKTQLSARAAATGPTPPLR